MDHRLLESFFNGECSAQEQQKVLEWYLSGKADQELAEKIESYWQDGWQKQTKDWTKDALYSSIESKLDTRNDSSASNSKNVGSGRVQAWRYAAVISLLLASFALLYFQFLRTEGLFLSEEVSTDTSNTPSLISKETSRGEKLSIRLRDRTMVKLNAESRLWYTATLGDSVREVFLEGEAFFDVAEDSTRPFLIHTGEITTRVVGTSFNIKAFTGEEQIAVSVLSGKVQVSKGNDVGKAPVHLVPGEQAVYTHLDTSLAKQRFSYQDVLSWKDGTLYFKNTPFAEVVQSLERWYGVDIVVHKQGIENGFSGSYTKRSLESVLEGMSFVLDFEYEIQENLIIIK